MYCNYQSRRIAEYDPLKSYVKEVVEDTGGVTVSVPVVVVVVIVIGGRVVVVEVDIVDVCMPRKLEQKGVADGCLCRTVITALTARHCTLLIREGMICGAALLNGRATANKAMVGT